MVKLYVEGGGESNLLRSECRRGFSEFLSNAGLSGRMPRIVASGGRTQAYNDFCTAIANGEPAMLLVDSEGPVAAQHEPDGTETLKPWLHLAQRVGDGWAKPVNAGDEHCHLMAQCMESWILADRATLKSFFDPGFKPSALPSAANPVEGVAKTEVYHALAIATKDCKTKEPYSKGVHSFKLLALIDPSKVTAASPWAKRFVEEAARQMAC